MRCWPRRGSSTFDDLYRHVAPDRSIIDVFRVKYDYHNAKVLLKSEARGVDAGTLLVDTGRVSPEELQEHVRASDFRGLPGHLAGAIAQARDTLGSTGDPQLSDFVLDRAYFEDMFDLARASGSAFLEGYVRINIDVANLKSLVRTLRMGKDVDFLRGACFPGATWMCPGSDCRRQRRHPHPGALCRLRLCGRPQSWATAPSPGRSLDPLRKALRRRGDGLYRRRPVCGLWRSPPGGLSGGPGERIHRRAHHHDGPSGGSPRRRDPGKAA